MIHHWESITESDYGSFDLSMVREWAGSGSPTMADVFGQLHAASPRAEHLAPFKMWASSAEIRPDLVASGEVIGMQIMLIDVGAFALPDRNRAENHAALSSAAERFGDRAWVDLEQAHGADGYWLVSDKNYAQIPKWCRRGIGIKVPVEIGTCAPGQLGARLLDMGACVRWPYGSTDAVLITTNIIAWKARMFDELS